MSKQDNLTNQFTRHKLKKFLLIIGAVIILITCGVIAMFINAGKITSAYNDFDFGNIDLSLVEDGTYTGSEDGSMVKASVEVTVKDHAITQVKILSHECGTGKPAEVIVDDIVKANSLQVDTISGATFSSNVIKMAVFNALTQAQ